jgi:hypothetical protein
MAGLTVRKYASPVRDERKALPSLMGLYFMLMTFNPAINGWVTRQTNQSSPVGTKERLYRP